MHCTWRFRFGLYTEENLSTSSCLSRKNSRILSKFNNPFIDPKRRTTIVYIEQRTRALLVPHIRKNKSLIKENKKTNTRKIKTTKNNSS